MNRTTLLAASAAIVLSLTGYARPGFSQAVQRNVAYGTDPAQRMDVYLPAHARNAPIIFMVHGGGWRRGDKAMNNVVANKVAYWVPRGYVFISTNYRMLPGADPITQAGDVARALAHAQAHASEWGADGARVVLMGHSAGAHLVALLTANPSLATAQGAKPWIGLISLDSGTLDVVSTMSHRHLPLYTRAFGRDSKYWSEASPLAQLTATPVPSLLVCSSRRDDSCPQARDFAAKATSLGGRSSVLPEDLSHEQVNETLGEQGAYTSAVESFLQSLGLP